MSRIVSDASYIFINSNSKTALDCSADSSSSPGTLVTGHELNINVGAKAASNQIWAAKKTSTDSHGHDWYTLTARRTGFNLELAPGDAKDGTKLATNAPNGNATQEWTFLPISSAEPNEPITYRLANHGAFESDRGWRCADLFMGKTANGSAIGIWEFTDEPKAAPDQIWMLVKVE